MVTANLLLTMSVYMLIPTLPEWLFSVQGFSSVETGLSMGAFALGLYLFGSLCSWLVQTYRRNVVCMWAIIALVVSELFLWYADRMQTGFADFPLVLCQRIVSGATFGLAQMILSSTLIIDTCESYQRTEANYSSSWFARFALSLGPLAGLLSFQLIGFSGTLLGSMGCAAVSVLLIKMVDFPFRAPEEHEHIASLDRFLLPRGFVLFANLMLVSGALGLLLSQSLSVYFYSMVMVGFLLALLAGHFVFRNAEMKSEAVSGLILLMASEAILLTHPESILSPLFLGLGVGIVSSRFLLFFIKLSRHCQRGTSQSMYFLGWETGLALGLGAGCWAVKEGQPDLPLTLALVLTALALLMYHFFTHAWFMRKKNR